MTDRQDNATRRRAPGGDPSGVRATKVLDAEDIFQGGRTVKLVYLDQEYCLRITRNGRLILTK